MAWLGTYAHRVKVTASNTNVDADLTQFPLLLKLGTSVGTGANDVSFVFDELTSDANRKKIAVTDTTGDTQLYVEIEKWDDTNESAILWVSKSDWVLDHDANTELYLYYDSSQADNDTYVGDGGGRTEVWDSGYLGVWHFNEDPSGAAPQMLNSVSANVDGTSVGTMLTEDLVNAKIGKGLQFDGSNDKITFGTGLSTSYFTVEAWVKYDGAVEAHELFKKEFSWSIQSDASGNFYCFAYAGGSWRASGVAPTAGSTSVYLYVVGTYDGSNAYCYTNGVAGSAGAYSGTAGSSSNVATINLDAACIIDEPRLSNIARTASWIKANFYSMTDALVSWGTEESNFISPFPTYFNI
jgi:hypothetical protein